LATSPVILAYVPVLHLGYARFFEKYPGAKLNILGPAITSQYRPLARDLRALDPERVKSALIAWKMFSAIEIVEIPELKSLAAAGTELIMPDEDISHDLAAQFFADTEITFDAMFLRWDRRRTDARETITTLTSASEYPTDIARMTQATQASNRSSDIWRRVGAVITTANDRTLEAHYNRSLPSANTPWAVGDPRGNYGKGLSLELSLFIHAEAAAIGDAAKRGVALRGASIYVTTFPCPACAKLIAIAGITTCYYAAGYAVLDGQDVLAAANVTIINVPIDIAPEPPDVWVPYPDTTPIT
jgi:dCMP deaminase